MHHRFPINLPHFFFFFAMLQMGLPSANHGGVNDFDLLATKFELVVLICTKYI